MSSFFITLLNMSLTASYVAIIVIFIRYILAKCRVPKIFSYALWVVVLFRLIFPFSFESVFSLIPTKTNAIPQDIIYSENPVVSTGIVFLDKAFNDSIQAVLVPVDVTASINPIQIFLEISSLIWLLGVAALIIYALVSYVQLKRRLTFATRRKDNIFETDQITTPFVLGFLKPRIYVPVGVAGQDMDYILKHEQVHIMRYDHFIKPVAFLVLSLHWFNPLIWLSYYLMIKDMEMSCDERVMKESSEDVRLNYATTLLSLASKQSGLIGPLSFGESHVKSRVRNVLNYKRPVFWVLLLVIIIVAALAISLLVNPISKQVISADEEQIVSLVEDFGSNLRKVSLLDLQAKVARQMQDHYSEYVSQHLIDQWVDAPEAAPGRLTSSPWPDRIDITSVERMTGDTYEVKGLIIEVLSEKTVEGNVAAMRSIVLEVKKVDGRWLIDACTLGAYTSDVEAIKTMSYENSAANLADEDKNEEIDLKVMFSKWDNGEIVDSEGARIMQALVDFLNENPQISSEEIKELSNNISILAIDHFSVIQYIENPEFYGASGRESYQIVKYEGRSELVASKGSMRIDAIAQIDEVSLYLFATDYRVSNITGIQIFNIVMDNSTLNLKSVINKDKLADKFIYDNASNILYYDSGHIYFKTISNNGTEILITAGDREFLMKLAEDGQYSLSDESGW